MVYFRRVLLVTAVVSAGIASPHPGTSQQRTSAGEKSELAQRAINDGQYEKAQKLYEEIVAKSPQLPEAHANLGLAYFQEGRFQDAVNELRRAIAQKPSLARSEILLGMSLSELGRAHDSLKGLELGFQSTDLEIRRSCGLRLLRMYTLLNRDSDAVSVALALKKQSPGDPEVLYHTGRIFGNFAYLTMQELYDRAPDSIWMLQAQAEADESQKAFQSAISGFNHVLEIDPRRPGIHYRLGRIYLAMFTDFHRREDRDLAGKEFEAELQRDPGNGNALYELARMAEEDTRPDRARELFEDAVARFPEFEQGWVGLAGVYLDTGLHQKAVDALQRAVQLDSGDEVAWYRLSEAERHIGDRAAATRALDKFRLIHSSTSKPRKTSADEITPQSLDATNTP